VSVVSVVSSVSSVVEDPEVLVSEVELVSLVPVQEALKR